MPGEPGANVVLIRGRAAAFLPGHSHRGGEFTQVLAGAINEPGRHYAAGDMFEADDTTNHHLTVAADGVCICLAAFEGRQRMDSLIGRLVQPLLGP